MTEANLRCFREKYTSERGGWQDKQTKEFMAGEPERNITVVCTILVTLL